MMKNNIKKIVITALSFSILISLSGSVITAQGNREKMNPGTVFFAPMTDVGMHPVLSGNPIVNGTEIFTTWGEIEKEEGVYDWSEIDEILEFYKEEGKKVSIRIASASFSINDTPEYVFNKYGVRRIAPGPFLNFEKDFGQYNVLSGEIIQDNPENKAFKVTSSGNEIIFLETDTSHDLFFTEGYSVQFDYKTSRNAVLFARVTFMSGGEEIIDEYEFTSDSEMFETGSLEIDMKGPEIKIQWGIKSDGDVIIDNINIIKRKSGYHVGTLTFPYYLDPEFKVAYEKFVKTFAEKYNGNPVISNVKVGGYGRWEEMTLCDDVEHNWLQDQWIAYGYSDDEYIDHVKWCIDTYLKYFTSVNVSMCGVGYGGNDYFKNQVLVDWAVQNHALKRGVGIQYNGWQSVCTEWGSSATAIFYMMNRFKQAGVDTAFEQGGQINNDGALPGLPPFSEIMGHPLSLYNVALLYGVNYQWTYSTDIAEPYITRNAHYLNQGSGNTLITKLYSQLGEYVFNSNTKLGRQYTHTDIQNGIIQTKGNDKLSVVNDYVLKGGKLSLTAGSDRGMIQFSLDDRMKYEGMYGSYLVVNYFDEGNDTFVISGMTPNGVVELETVNKTGTNQWKSVSVYNEEWTNYHRGGGSDILNELTIDEADDGKEYISSVEVNFVPAREYKESIIAEVIPSENFETGIQLSRDPFSLIVKNETGKYVSGISLPVSALSDKEMTVLRARIYGEKNGEEILVSSKEYYMPGENDWFYIPLAFEADLEEYRVEMVCEKGNAVWNTESNSNPGYKLYEFNEGEKENVVFGESENGVTMEAVKPFNKIVFDEENLYGGKLSISKIMDGSRVVKIMDNLIVSENGAVVFTPQTAGRYIVSFEDQVPEQAQIVYLDRRYESNIAYRYLLGDEDLEFVSGGIENVWKEISGFKNIEKSEEGSFVSRLASENAYIATGEDFKLTGVRDHIFHIVIKNETSSGLLKLMWKTDDEEYSETNSQFIPILPNDTSYREYSFQIGLDGTFRGNITGLKVIPAYGNTDTGIISIYTMGIRKGFARQTEYASQLKLDDVKQIAPINFSNPVNPKSTIPGWGIAILIASVIISIGIVVFALKHRKNGSKVSHNEQKQ